MLLNLGGYLKKEPWYVNLILSYQGSFLFRKEHEID